ncbi:MAG: hypothetical protein EOP04_19625 [Proteobacteria bacterium]|nr:MAG: hypothetical protein EOP04_19625 [Pseudomonadota bacterium]
MKQILLMFFIAGTTNAHSASSLDQVVCGVARTFYIKGGTSGSEGQTSTQANSDLNTKLSQFPGSGSTGTLGGRPVQVGLKSVSKPSIESTVFQATGSQCYGQDYGKYEGTCETVTICATVSVTFTECKPTKFDENSGKRYAVCPNGNRLEF